MSALAQVQEELTAWVGPERAAELLAGVDEAALEPFVSPPVTLPSSTLPEAEQFDPDQPRDEAGRWSDGGGGGGGSRRRPPAGEPTTAGLDVPASQRIGRRVKAQDGECYRNAARAVVLLGGDARYVEGYVVYREDGFKRVCSHAWIERANGRIIEPTPIYRAAVKEAKPPIYFPAVRWSAADIRRVVQRGTQFPPASTKVFPLKRTPAHHAAAAPARLAAWTLAVGPAMAAKLLKKRT